MNLKLTEFERGVIQEISTISGYTESQVREVLEFTFLRQVEQYIEGGKINIPFIGTCKVDYEGDDFVSGAKLARIKTELTPSLLFKRVVGGAEDGESAIIEDLLQGKIKAALQTVLDKE